MEDQLSMVVIDENAASRKFVVETFANIPQIKITGEASDLGRGYDLVRQTKPAIVMIDLFPSMDLALKLAEKTVQNFPQTTIFVTSNYSDSDTILKAMRAGGREFIMKPIKAEDLLNAMRTVIRIRNQQFHVNGIGGKLVTVFGVRGGVGATTLATNLGVNIAQQTGESVVLVDINLHLGDLALFLDIVPKYSIADIAYNLEDFDPAVLKTVLPRHASGIWLLAGSPAIEDSDTLTRKQFEHILLLLKSQFHHVIIDLSKVFDELTLKALDDADTILTVFTPEIPSVSNTLKTIKIFRRLEYSEEKVKLIVNRCDALNMIPEDELKRSLKYPIWWKIPNQNNGLVIRAMNKGIPISIMDPRSKISRSISDLTRSLVDHKAGPGKNRADSFGLEMLKKMFMNRPYATKER